MEPEDSDAGMGMLQIKTKYRRDLTLGMEPRAVLSRNRLPFRVEKPRTRIYFTEGVET